MYSAFPLYFFQEETSNRRKSKLPQKRWFFLLFFWKKCFFWPPPYSFRKRDDEAESGPSKKSLLSDTDIDQLTPPNNSPLPPASDEQNIRNIINFLEPHRNLSYIIEGRCVQKNSEGSKNERRPPLPPNFLSTNLFIVMQYGIKNVTTRPTIVFEYFDRLIVACNTSPAHWHIKRQWLLDVWTP